MDELTRRLLSREAKLLAPVLYEHFDLAITTARSLRFRETDHPHLHALYRRAEFRDGLEREGLPGGWIVAGNSRQTEQTVLKHAALGASLRLLSESTVTTNGVPHAGATGAQQAHWRNIALFGDDVPSDRELLLLMNARGETPTLRIVHPASPGRYRGSVACDFGIVMHRDVDDFGNVIFDSTEDHFDFFASIETDEAEGDV